MVIKYPAIFSPCSEKNGYTVVVPDLPGCVTEGDSLVEARAMAQDAASGWVLGEAEDGNPIPVPSAIETIQVGPWDFVELVTVTVDKAPTKE